MVNFFNIIMNEKRFTWFEVMMGFFFNCVFAATATILILDYFDLITCIDFLRR